MLRFSLVAIPGLLASAAAPGRRRLEGEAATWSQGSSRCLVVRVSESGGTSRDVPQTGPTSCACCDELQRLISTSSTQLFMSPELMAAAIAPPNQ